MRYAALYLIGIISLILIGCPAPQSPALRWSEVPLEQALYQAGIDYIDQKIYPGDVREYTQHHISKGEEVYMIKLKGTYYNQGLYSFSLQMRADKKSGEWAPTVTDWVTSSLETNGEASAPGPKMTR